jgi:hypothetical protein
MKKEGDIGSMVNKQVAFEPRTYRKAGKVNISKVLNIQKGHKKIGFLYKI